jgi:hypothetical protein
MITLSGRPLSSGKIILVPVSPSGIQAVGPIVGGNFSLTSFSANDGALPGPYTVVIVSPGVPARYQSQATSGLTVMVQKIQNTFDFSIR